MEIHQLQILRELGVLGSVSAVAEALEVSPSAVSQHLASLQRGFRTPLTRKQGRTLVLTEAGTVLAAAGMRVIDAMAEARTAVEEFELTTVGQVTVSGFHSAGQAFFGGLIRDLAAHPPGPEVHVSDEDVAQEDFPALTSRYDLVLAHRLEHSPPWPSAGLQVVPLLSEPLDVALAVSHPLAERTSLTSAEVAGERWVTSRHGYSPDDVLGAVAAVANRSLEVVHRINDYGAASAVVAAGGVICLLPRFTSPAARDDRIVLRPLTDVAAVRNIDVLARPETLRRRSVRLVVAALRRVVHDLTKGASPKEAPLVPSATESRKVASTSGPPCRLSQ
ncbi:MAG: LysR family transcriptional regulator [Microlunatus sp.]